MARHSLDGGIAMLALSITALLLLLVLEGYFAPREERGSLPGATAPPQTVTTTFRGPSGPPHVIGPSAPPPDY